LVGGLQPGAAERRRALGPPPCRLHPPAQLPPPPALPHLPAQLPHHHHLTTPRRLWNDVFCLAQDMLKVPRGTIRATVLIETILASFEMDEILFELREHSAGLNCGRWDYIFSFIKKLRNHSRVGGVVVWAVVVGWRVAAAGGAGGEALGEVLG
jgi:hypothetical protein